MKNIILLMQIQYPAYWNPVEYHRLFISRKSLTLKKHGKTSVLKINMQISILVCSTIMVVTNLNLKY